MFEIRALLFSNSQLQGTLTVKAVNGIATFYTGVRALQENDKLRFQESVRSMTDMTEPK